MIRVTILFATLALASAQFTKLQWSYCGSSVLNIDKFDATPMPIRHPGVVNVILSGKNTRALSGAFKTDVKIKRTVSGLTLNVSCYLVNGNSVGSCVYPDLCLLMNSLLSLTPQNCPQSLIDNGIDCRCPFNFPVKSLDVNASFNLPDASSTPINWIGSGDFDVTLNASDSVGQITCLNVKLSVRPK